MIDIVLLSKRAQKDLQKVPIHIVRKLDGWISSVEKDGLEEIRKVSGYHDEPLKGERAGQRSYPTQQELSCDLYPQARRKKDSHRQVRSDRGGDQT